MTKSTLTKGAREYGKIVVLATLELKHHQIVPYENQPRTSFPEAEIIELANSMQLHGQLTAVVVTQRPGSKEYVLIAGARRWRAVQLIRKCTGVAPKLRVEIVEYVDEDWLFGIAFIETSVHKSLSTLDRAAGYAYFRRKKYTIADIARVCSVSATTVTTHLDIYDCLCDGVKKLMDPELPRGERLSQNQASELTCISDHDEQLQWAQKTLEGNMSVGLLRSLLRNRRGVTRPTTTRQEDGRLQHSNIAAPKTLDQTLWSISLALKKLAKKTLQELCDESELEPVPRGQLLRTIQGMRKTLQDLSDKVEESTPD